MDEDQIILIDKPAGMSSFGVVAKVRAQLRDEFGHKVKVGHTGTLDPFATGLLILLSGKMTKKSNEFLKLDKEYIAELRLGYTSTTGDTEGEIQPYMHNVAARESRKLRNVINRRLYHIASPLRRQNHRFCLDVPRFRDSHVTRYDIESTLKSFVGEIEQTPPKFSAIKINGQRAYKLARAGEDFEVPSRKVTIYNIEILEYDYPKLTIRCFVSSGTYIRTLAEDIGKKLGTGAYLTALRRTRIGDYDIKDARVL